MRLMRSMLLILALPAWLGAICGAGRLQYNPITRSLDCVAVADVTQSSRVTGTATSVLTGSIDPTASTTATGVGTLFTAELVVGDRITVSGETRTVTAIASDTSLTVDTAFTDTANDTSPDKLAAIWIARDSAGVNKAVCNDLGNCTFTGSIVESGADVASAAIITLGQGNVFLVTGTTNIDTINTCDAANSGRTVVLIFAGILTVGDASNLRLNGAFVTTADDTLTLVCKTTTWYELARSVN